MTEVAVIRPERYSATRYEAFRLAETKWRAYPVRLDNERPATLSEAVEAAKLFCAHKDKLVIKATDEVGGAVTLYLYAVKRQSRPNYVYQDYATRAVHPLYVEPICVIDEAAFKLIVTGEAFTDIQRRLG